MNFSALYGQSFNVHRIFCKEQFPVIPVLGIVKSEYFCSGEGILERQAVVWFSETVGKAS